MPDIFSQKQHILNTLTSRQTACSTGAAWLNSAYPLLPDEKATETRHEAGFCCGCLKSDRYFSGKDCAAEAAEAAIKPVKMDF